MPESFAKLPTNLEEFVAQAHAFRPVLAKAKEEPPAPNLSWYPYDSLASIDHTRICVQDCFPEFLRALRSGPLLDVGCADGDLSAFFANMGLAVTAIDNRPTNYNWMAGIEALRERLAPAITILERDIDGQSLNTEQTCGLTLLLGILYHLKNPFYVLESISKQSRYCLLSTRIAGVTPKGRSIVGEPLAYLLEGRETNDDQTNYWIFSSKALDVLVRRSGWKVLGRALVGETRYPPEPVRPDRDTREFLFLRSTRLSLEAQLKKGEGWGEAEEHGWAWTLKRFSLTALLQGQEPPRTFRLSFRVPEVLASASDVAVSGSVNGVSLPQKIYKGAGDFLYEGALPASSAEMFFEFSVEHSFQPAPPETRDLGVIVSMRREVLGVSEPIPFYLD